MKRVAKLVIQLDISEMQILNVMCTYTVGYSMFIPACCHVGEVLHLFFIPSCMETLRRESASCRSVLIGNREHCSLLSDIYVVTINTLKQNSPPPQVWRGSHSQSGALSGFWKLYCWWTWHSPCHQGSSLGKRVFLVCFLFKDVFIKSCHISQRLVSALDCSCLIRYRRFQRY